jgi:hypothetical protein
LARRNSVRMAQSSMELRQTMTPRREMAEKAIIGKRRVRQFYVSGLSEIEMRSGTRPETRGSIGALHHPGRAADLSSRKKWLDRNLFQLWVGCCSCGLRRATREWNGREGGDELKDEWKCNDQKWGGDAETRRSGGAENQK